MRDKTRAGEKVKAGRGRGGAREGFGVWEEEELEIVDAGQVRTTTSASRIYL
jgi:hypothetical protein